MKVLVLGGTGFLGKNLVLLALKAGHEVTLFHRGQTNPDLFPNVEHILGDRDGGLDALDGRRWDAAVDTSGHVPRVVREAAERLASAVGHYTFVSSVSALRDFRTVNQDETAAVGTLGDKSIETIDAGTYGPLKALCEQAAQKAMPGRVLICRPGLIVGPEDPTWRFTYWVERVARAGLTLVPEPERRRVQFIDVRDLAAWMLRMIERRTIGTFHATGPEEPLTFGEMIRRCAAALEKSPEFVWVAESFLIENRVGPWMELPLWLPGEEWIGHGQVNCAKAIAYGLTFRSLENTVRDTLDWARSVPAGAKKPAGLDPDKEIALLESWTSRPARRG